MNNHRPSGDEVDLLNDAGMDGWELVGITSNRIAYLKRRILSDARQNSSAFPGGRGTADMVRRAREAGVETIEGRDGGPVPACSKI